MITSQTCTFESIRYLWWCRFFGCFHYILTVNQRKKQLCRMLGMLTQHGEQQQTNMNHCSTQTEQKFSWLSKLFSEISPEWIKMPFKNPTETLTFCPLNEKKCLLLLCCGVVGAVECVTQLSHPSFRPSFVVMSQCFLSKSGRLSVSARKQAALCFPECY